VGFDVAYKLVRGGTLPQPHYRLAIRTFGQHPTNELIYLIGPYSLVSSTLNGFQCPGRPPSAVTRSRPRPGPLLRTTAGDKGGADASRAHRYSHTRHGREDAPARGSPQRINVVVYTFIASAPVLEIAVETTGLHRQVRGVWPAIDSSPARVQWRGVLPMHCPSHRRRREQRGDDHA